jgi:hypothetical protein
MPATSSTTLAHESASRSRRAGATEELPAEAGSDVLQSISRVIYSGSYALAYGIVYSVVIRCSVLASGEPVDARITRRRDRGDGRAQPELI